MLDKLAPSNDHATGKSRHCLSTLDHPAEAAKIRLKDDWRGRLEPRYGALLENNSKIK